MTKGDALSRRRTVGGGGGCSFRISFFSKGIYSELHSGDVNYPIGKFGNLRGEKCGDCVRVYRKPVDSFNEMARIQFF